MEKETDIRQLLDDMTQEEKIGQLLQLLPLFYDADRQGSITGPLRELQIDEEVIWRSGSVIGVTKAEDMIEIQKKYLEKSRLKIPLLFMLDLNHGFRTIFPIPLGMACSWNTSCIEEAARITAKEASLSGVHANFSPMADLVRDPRWGRVMESTGEDPYLNGLYAAAAVRGHKGTLITCVKHFAGYGAAEGGREYNTVDLSDHNLREYYLTAYKAAIEAGCEMVMASFNPVNGIPASGNSYLLRDILRKEWGFDGPVISDWASIEELIPHGVAADGKEAALLAMKAGVDIEMMTSNYVKHLKELMEEGAVEEELLEEAVYRVLKLKKDFGLLDNPYKEVNPQKAQEIFVCKEFREEAREIASKSMVLLKNEGILPFKKKERIAVLGPHADNTKILGGWRALGKEEETVSIYKGLCGKVGAENVITEKGCDINGEEEGGFSAALRAAREADVVLLALGEEQDMSGEAASRAFLTIPGIQGKLLSEVLKLGKPTAVVLLNGRPLEIRTLTAKAPAILEAWFPGTEGGNAIADILYGDVNPSGRLTMSFPYTVGQIPVYYNHFNTGRPAIGREKKDVSRYLDIPNKPLFPFGYGLSYTTFSYSEIELSRKVIKVGESLKTSIEVENTGDRTGTETVQLYMRDLVGSTIRPVKELKGFRQISLLAGEKRRVEFEITTDMLKFHNSKGEYVAEPGEFRVMIGRNSEETKEVVFRMIL